MTTDKIKVAVRVRPFNRRELELGTQSVVEMDDYQTILQSPSSMDKIDRKQPKTFAFDHCFYSIDTTAAHFASQEKVFDCVGRDILYNAFEGYNACIFAYGQTGSGKSYTMMGSQDNKGIIPRLCDLLFASIAAKQTPELSYKVEVSYMEIYNEKVHDLLDPKPNKQSLKVREHNVLGPYVDGLSQLAVSSFHDIDSLMTEGNKSRTVAATNMNAESSRSHAVFSVVLTQTITDTQSGVTGEKASRMSLVDLAGSERAVKTGAVGDRLKEGSNINKSLTTLGLVISKLADQTNSKRNDKFVPYRDSVLTWLLKDNLGGNSKTVMVATISPAEDNFEETLSTLRYADRAKRIVNHAVVNEDPNARIIRELRMEVEALREMLKHAVVSVNGSPVGETQRVDIHDKLEESENLMKQISQTWEEKLVKTERIQNERQQALEKMGISVQASGIMVEKNKYYLVNLNADPSLNELLVYYLKERTNVGGRSFMSPQPDIQLSGLGIQDEHCFITIEDGGLFMEAVNNARCFVNGSAVSEKTPLHHGDRILWGNHHFFRVNCPRNAGSMPLSEPHTPAQPIDYEFAREELMQNELINDPIQSAIEQLEKQHEEDKLEALEKQRQEYERQFQQLRNILSPTTPYAPYAPYDPLRLGKITPNTPNSQMRVEKWAQERDEMFRRSLGQLKTDIMRANGSVQEANFLAEEMEKQTKFSVTLQIPPANLSPNRRRGAFVSEPAILVRRLNAGSQVWSMEKLENKLIDMREMYQECKERCLNGLDEGNVKSLDPFYESQENHNLIGVANIFLEVLFHDVKLDYHTPIISQQGEVAGRLQVEISKIAGQLPQDRMCEAASNSSTDSRDDDYHNDGETDGANQVTCRVSIKVASGLPLSLSNFVFCQYTFWGHTETVVPVVNCEQPAHNQNSTFNFEHTADYTVSVTEEFLEHCAEGALSIEVWGHRSAGFSRTKGWEVEQQQAKARSLVDRWAELSRKIELWVEIHELNDNGEYTPVEVTNRAEVLTGGVYQLRQGQQRRVQVRVKPVQNSGTLPIICQSIISVAVGSVTVRSRLQKPMDSYQEEDLTVLREKWSEALGRRRKYLDQQIQKLINKEDKTEEERERELSLVHQWVSLTEERNAVLVPAPGSGIPGAPASWEPPSGMEPHVPVLFLDLNADDLSAQSTTEELSMAGINSILPKEHGNKFYTLQILQHLDKDVCAISSWDSSIHDSQALNRVTEVSERVYLILKTTVRLSHPAPMDLVLRKRIGLNIFKRQSIAERLKKSTGWLGGRAAATLTQSGVTYEVVSNIPKASEELEDRESLAQLAASGDECSASDGETYIEKYTRGVSAVESILTLDRLRQNVAIKELEQTHGQPMSMRKTVSVPNFSQAVRDTSSFGGMMRFDASMESLINAGRSGSFADLNSDFGPMSRSFTANSSSTRDLFNAPQNAPAAVRTRHSFGGKSTNSSEDPLLAGTGGGKPFGIARPTFLNLNVNLNTLRQQQSTSKPSPASAKLGLRMTTLHEEPSSKNALAEEDSYSDPDYPEYETAEERATQQQQQQQRTRGPAFRNRMTASKTLGSLTEIQRTGNDTSAAMAAAASTAASAQQMLSYTHSSNAAVKHVVGTPSMSSSASSGYGSQAVSCSNLTNDDALSLRSVSADDTPDFERSSSTSPPHKATAPLSATASACSPYTPGQSQKRFNPFLKDQPTTQLAAAAAKSIDAPVKVVVTPLTPTKEHPLCARNDNSDDDSEDEYNNRPRQSSAQPKPRPPSQRPVCENANIENIVDSTSASVNDVNKNNIITAAGGDDDGPAHQTATDCSHSSNDDDSTHSGSGIGIVRTQLPPGKVVRRKKSTTSPATTANRHQSTTTASNSTTASHATNANAAVDNRRMSHGDVHSKPPPRGTMSKSMEKLDAQMRQLGGSGAATDSTDRLADEDAHAHAAAAPEWVVTGESVLIRPYNLSGVISFVGTTHFQAGTWVGVELDTPQGKNDGSVQGIQYFECKPKHGIFVRCDKLIADKRGRQMRAYKSEKNQNNMVRSRSRGESLNILGTAGGTRK